MTRADLDNPRSCERSMPQLMISALLSCSRARLLRQVCSASGAARVCHSAQAGRRDTMSPIRPRCTTALC